HKVYTEEETTQAMAFIQEHQLSMSDLLCALKYVRILNGGHAAASQIPETPPEPKVPEVEPPPIDWQCPDMPFKWEDV
ncbi:hypothetical protein KR018_000939, partial [Drosophila ironensis]